MAISSNVEYVVQGGPDEPCVLFLHELGGSLHSWQWLDPLLGDEFRRIHVDIPAVEATRNDPLAPLASAAEALRDLLDALDQDRVHVVGAAYGAILAAFLSANHPTRVGRLVLMAVGPALPEAANQHILKRADVVETQSPEA